MIGTEKAGARRKRLSWMASTFILTNIGLFFVVALGFYSFGSAGSALAYLRGDRLIVRRSSMSFGEVKQGERPVVTFELTNTSHRKITILGAKTLCTCVFTDDLPLSVPPGGRRSIGVAVKTSSRAGVIEEPISLYTDYPEQPEVEVRVLGRVSVSGGRSSKAGPQ